jgi:hypothetical protein
MYIDSSRGCHLGTSGLYISWFNQINSFPRSLLILYHHAPLIFTSSLYSALLYSYIDGCFSIFHSLTFSSSLPPPVALSDGLANIILFSLSHYIMDIWSYMFLCTHLTCRSSFHIWGKTCDLWIFESVKCHSFRQYSVVIGRMDYLWRVYEQEFQLVHTWYTFKFAKFCKQLKLIIILNKRSCYLVKFILFIHTCIYYTLPG